MFGMEFNKLLEINGVNIKRIPTLNALAKYPVTLFPVSRTAGAMQDQIFDLLMDATIRRGDGIILSSVQKEYKDEISKFIQRGEPIKFVYQGFPFKCHNPVETLRRTPDLGELACFQRLMDINETVKQIYSPGVTFTILTEGNSYKNLFGASQKELEVYQNRCEYFTRLIEAEKLIKFIDFLDLVENKGKFLKLCQKEENYIETNEIEHFVPVMMRSLPIINKVSFEDLLVVFGFGDNSQNLTNFEKEFAHYIKDAAKELAIKYLAIQKAKKNLDVVGSRFQGSLYISTTVKPDRYSFHPIHRKTRLFSHHGVPILGSDKVDIVYLGEVITSPEIYTAVYCGDDIEDAPFYFLKGKQHMVNRYDKLEK
jgi:hypothetical protein